jgi:hypothetical protein
MAKKQDVIQETLAFWQKRTTRRLTEKDAEEIVENLTDFLILILEWDAKNTSGRVEKHEIHV